MKDMITTYILQKDKQGKTIQRHLSSSHTTYTEDRKPENTVNHQKTH